MTTSPISPVPPASPRSSGVQRSGDSAEAQETSGSFSSVLARQNGNSAGKPDGVATPGAPPQETTNTRTQPGRTAQQEGDEPGGADEAAEQGLSLAQQALSIAAEVAAVRRSATAVDQLGASLTQQGARQADRNTADMRLSGAALAVIAANARAKASSTAAAQSDIDAKQHRALPSGFVPAQAADGAQNAASLAALTIANTGSTPGAPVASGRAASIAGAKQAVLAMQARAQAASAASAGAKLPEFITLANGAAVAGSTGVQVDTGLIASTAETSLGQLGVLASAHAADTSQASNTGRFSLLMGASGQATSFVATPLNSPQWGSDFGRQFVSMAQGAHNMPHTAELRLDPPELGPLRVSINVVDNVAHAVFVSAHASVRQTLENSLPQLQQLLAQAGISLGQTSVSDQGLPQHAFGDGDGSNQGRHAAPSTVGTGGMDAAATGLRNASRIPAADALVDTFA